MRQIQKAPIATKKQVTDSVTSPRVLLLPGWQNSDAGHWQSRWETLYGYERVQQHDWQRPLRGDWSARLQDTVVDSAQPVVLVAHSLGCILTAWWAAHSPLAKTRVQAALLVAPADVEQEHIRNVLPGWSPLMLQRLPFPSVLVGSQNDPYCALARTLQMAQGWGSKFVDLGCAGHINTDSGLGDWNDGHALLQSLMKD